LELPEDFVRERNPSADARVFGLAFLVLALFATQVDAKNTWRSYSDDSACWMTAEAQGTSTARTGGKAYLNLSIFRGAGGPQISVVLPKALPSGSFVELRADKQLIPLLLDGQTAFPKRDSVALERLRDAQSVLLVLNGFGYRVDMTSFMATYAETLSACHRS
jgi:hypothetical protein